jgi:alkaline phosphatase
MTHLSRSRVVAALGVLALTATSVVVANSADAQNPSTTPAATNNTHQAVPKARSVVLLNGDGMGPAQRTFIQYALYGVNKTQPMDNLPHNGSLRTHSADPAFITDSGAGATAWAIGRKTLNDRVGVDRKGRPVRSILEMAKAAGKTTALIEDHDVTNATMAPFGADEVNRDHKVAIAKDYLYRTHPDIMFGGGQKIWYPKGVKGPVPGGDPSEGKTNLVKVAKKQGYQYAYNRKTFAKLTGPRALALVRDDGLEFSEEVKGYKPHKDPYYVAEHLLVKKALQIASQNPKGFFMAIDVDEIDDGGHDHDGPLILKAGAELNRIVNVLKAFHASHPETLIIVTADHETGGLTLEDKADGGAGVAPDDPEPYYDEDHPRNVQIDGKLPVDSGPFKVKGMHRKFTLDWTTPEHTGVNVPVSAIGPNAGMLEGVHDNTYVFDVMHKTLFGH